MYIVHPNYGKPNELVRIKTSYLGHTALVQEVLHLVRCPDGSGKLFNKEELKKFLVGKDWRYAQ